MPRSDSRRSSRSAAASLRAAARLLFDPVPFYVLFGPDHGVVDLRHVLVTVNRSHYSRSKVRNPGRDASTTVGSKTQAPRRDGTSFKNDQREVLSATQTCLLALNFRLLHLPGGERP